VPRFCSSRKKERVEEWKKSLCVVNYPHMPTGETWFYNYMEDLKYTLEVVMIF
jgi:aspartate/methionine/tyrosine aminotransferase